MVLQSSHYKDSQYERPSQKWLCGHQRTDGVSCWAGPDGKGNCSGGSQCEPTKKGDRWHCTRPNYLGGKCREGPYSNGTCCMQLTKCRPHLSTESRRWLITKWWVSVVLVGILVILLGPDKEDFLSAGELSSPHRIEDGACKDCHSFGESELWDWPGIFLSESAATHQDKLCVKCHEKDRFQMSTHGLHVDQLKQISLTSHLQSNTRDNKIEVDTPECSNCHSEHKGNSNQLAQVDDRQCQTCHVDNVAGLTEGHAEFTDYPYNRKTRIFYDHYTHEDDYFEDDKNAHEDCTGCHIVGISGKYMGLKNFEIVCGACHNDQFRKKPNVREFAMFTIPGLDLATLKENDIIIGDWPVQSKAKLTPYMTLMLATDKSLQVDLTVVSEVNLRDLSGANTEQLISVSKVALAIKLMYQELLTTGRKGFIKKLKLINGDDNKLENSVTLAKFLPISEIKNLTSLGFPNMKKEVKYLKENGTLNGFVPEVPNDSSLIPKNKVASVDWKLYGGWYQSGYSLLYNPGQHVDTTWYSFLNFAADWPKTSTPGFVKLAFDRYAKQRGPGKCSWCHTIDNTEIAPQINWLPKEENRREKTFTHFSHIHHFSLLPAEGCESCHKLNPDSDYPDHFKSDNPLTFTANFDSMESVLCSSCHRGKIVNDSCITCHNYHINVVDKTTLLSN